MITLDCNIEVLHDEKNTIGIVIDLSCVLEPAVVAFDSLLQSKLKKLFFKDSDSGWSVVVSVGDRLFFEGSPMELNVTRSDLEIIKSMLLDIWVGKGFAGYHYDIDYYLRKNGLQVSFVFK